MTISLSTHRPAQTYSGHVLVGYFFSNSRPPRGIAGYVDWIMDGQISNLIVTGKVKGSFCESLLMFTGAKINAHFLLIIGAGNPKKLNPKAVKQLGMHTIKVLEGLKILHFGLYPHDLFLPHLDMFDILDELFNGLKMSPCEDIQISLLSNDQAEEERITKWLKDKTYIFNPNDYNPIKSI